uniref:Uncharacterized protein n=1 Tax=Cacopsylla melanoneura TaxID=428564 RepID=A0A8D8T4N8_9HEMI
MLVLLSTASGLMRAVISAGLQVEDRLGQVTLRGFNPRTVSYELRGGTAGTGRDGNVGHGTSPLQSFTGRSTRGARVATCFSSHGRLLHTREGRTVIFSP